MGLAVHFGSLCWDVCFKMWVERGCGRAGEFRFGFYKGLTNVEDEAWGRNLGERWDQRLFFLFGLCVP